MSGDTHRHALPAGFRLHWYRIVRVLGQGGFGITYLATDTNLDTEVAIKEFLPSELSVRDRDASVQPIASTREDDYRFGLERFMTEARTLARLRHRSVVEVLSVFTANNTAYMVMTYERGESLAQVLARRRTLPEHELKTLLVPLLDGLAYVHAAGFVHRDLKPSNIYLRREGDPLLIDFGSARQAIGDHTRTLTSVVSAGYAPFEQYSGRSSRQGPWTDIYGMGATLYHAVTGHAPLAAIDRSEDLLGGGSDSLRTLAGAGASGYSKAFLAAIDRALAFRPEDRPQSVADWKASLFGTGPATAIPRPPRAAAPERPSPSRGAAEASDLPQVRNDKSLRQQARDDRREVPRRPAVAIGGALAAVAILTAALGGFHVWQRARPGEAPVVTGAAPAPVPTPAATPPAPTPPPPAAPAPASALEPAPAPESAAARAARERAARLQSLLAQAAAAVGGGELVGAPTSGAALYREALALDPDNGEAAAGLAGIAATLVARADEALRKGRLEAAATDLATLRAFDADAPELASLARRLEAARERRQQDAEVDALLAAGRKALDEGRIVAPPGDNAYDTFRRVEALRPGLGALKQAYVDIGNHLMALADRASQADRFDEAYRYLAMADAILPGRPELAGARKYVDVRKLDWEQAQRRRETFGRNPP